MALRLVLLGYLVSLPAFAQISGGEWFARGRVALDEKHYAEAVTDFGQAEIVAPGTTSALALKAKALLHLDRFEDAQQCLETYLKSRPQSADARYLLGFVLFRRDMPRDSLAVYTEAAKLQRPAAEDFKIVGLDYVLLNDNADAIRWLERSVAEGPSDAEAQYCLGRAYYVQNSFEKAIASFERALALDPGYAKAENNLGLAQEGKNDNVAAEKAFRTAIEMENKSGKRTDQPSINLADLLSRDTQHDEALRLLDSAEQIGGKSSKVEEIRGRIDLADGKLDPAEEHFRAAIGMKPQDGALHYLLGRVLKREGKSAEAETEFSRTKGLLDGNGKQAEAETLRKTAKKAALAKMQAGDLEGASQLLSEARKTLPDDPELLYESGFVAFAAGRRQEAQHMLEEALRISPDYGDAAYELARVYLAGNLAEQAETQMRSYLQRKPEDATAQYGLGYILVAEQKRGEAKAAFEKSLALQPTQTESIFQLGLLAAEDGQGEAARARFTKVLAQDSKHAGALTEMGILAFQKGQYEEAEENLERAIRSAPAYQKAHYYYALTLSKLGKKDQASNEFETAKSLEKLHGVEGTVPGAQ